MLDGHVQILLQDMLARRAIDDRLWFVQVGEGNQAVTTETVVSVMDPLKPVSQILDSLRVSPTSPASSFVIISSGAFYCRGTLYTFYGKTFGPLHLDLSMGTTAWIGLQINAVKITATASVIYGGAEQLVFHPNFLPLAVVSILPTRQVVLSADILDLRPFFSFDPAGPQDRVEAQISCIGAGESICIDRSPFHKGAPIIQLYQKYLSGGFHDIVHTYNSLSKGVGVGDNAHLVDFDATYRGVTIKPLVERLPNDLPDAPTTIFVSAERGSSTNPGSKAQPVMTLADAVVLANANSAVTTIFIEAGIYTITDPLIFTNSVTIVGYSPDDVQIRTRANQGAISCNSDLRIEAISFRLKSYTSVDMPAVFVAGSITMLNCSILHMDDNAMLPVYKADTLVLSNLVFHNLWSIGVSLFDVTPSLFIGMHNIIVIGDWGDKFQVSPTILYAASTELKLENPLLFKYRPLTGSVCLNTGSYAVCGANKDGTQPDIGLYGGQYAALADVKRIPIGKLVLVRYAVQTMFAPVIHNFTFAQVIGEKPNGTEIYGCVSFDGGKNWVVWDEGTAAWKKVNPELLSIEGNTAQDLCTYIARVSNLGTRGEIVFLWGLFSTVSDKAPVITQCLFKARGSTGGYIPYSMENVEILVDDFSVLLRNKLDTPIRDLIVVVQ